MTIRRKMMWFLTRKLAKYRWGRSLLWFAFKQALWRKWEYLVHRGQVMVEELIDTIAARWAAAV
jgi:hypothetical protein